MDFTTSKPTSRRLLFDRRYGWVVDEWKDPSMEALAGCRGMFCILPLAKNFMKSVSLSANSAGRSTAKVLQTNLHDQLRNIASLVPKPDFNSQSAHRMQVESKE